MARSTSRKRRTASERFVWTKELIMFLSGLGLLIALTIWALIPTKSERFYNEWTEAAAANEIQNVIPKENVFEYIDYSDLKKKIDKKENEPIYVFYAYSEDVNCLNNIYTLQQKAEYYDVEKIYVLNADFYAELEDEDKVQDNKEYKEILEQQEALGVEFDKIGQLWVFNKGSIKFNSSDEKFEEQSFDFIAKKCFQEFAVKDSINL